MMSTREVLRHMLLLVLVIALAAAAPVSKSTGQNDISSESSSLEEATHKVSSPEEELKSLPVHAEEAAVPDFKSQEIFVPKPEGVAQPSANQPEEGVDKRSQQQPAAVATIDITKGQLEIDNQPIDRQPIMEDTQFMDNLPDTDSLAPKAVAEYLFLTGDWDSFNAATSDLLKSAILSRDEVRQYREDVAWEYVNIIRQLLQAETDSLAAYAQSSYPNFLGQNNVQKDYDDFPQRSANTFEPSYNDVYEEMKRMRMEELLEREAARDQLLQALIEDYVDSTPSADLPLDTDSVDPDRDAEFRVIMDLMAEAMNVPEMEEEEPVIEMGDGQEDERMLLPMEAAEPHHQQENDMVQQLLESANHQQRFPEQDLYNSMAEEQQGEAEDTYLPEQLQRFQSSNQHEFPQQLVESSEQDMANQQRFPEQDLFNSMAEEQQEAEDKDLTEQLQRFQSSNQHEFPQQLVESSEQDMANQIHQLPQAMMMSNQVPDQQVHQQEQEKLQDAVEDELESLQRQQQAPASQSQDQDKEQHTEVETKAVSDNN